MTPKSYYPYLHPIFSQMLSVYLMIVLSLTPNIPTNLTLFCALLLYINFFWLRLISHVYSLNNPVKVPQFLLLSLISLSAVFFTLGSWSISPVLLSTPLFIMLSWWSAMSLHYSPKFSIWALNYFAIALMLVALNEVSTVSHLEGGIFIQLALGYHLGSVIKTRRLLDTTNSDLATRTYIVRGFAVIVVSILLATTVEFLPLKMCLLGCILSLTVNEGHVSTLIFERTKITY